MLFALKSYFTYFGSMKTSIDIPDQELKDVMRNTRAKTKREAILRAIAEFNRRARAEKMIRKFGTMDGIMTQEQLQKMRDEP
jgi:Arc/MetJ family transcription regulator